MTQTPETPEGRSMMLVERVTGWALLNAALGGRNGMVAAGYNLSVWYARRKEFQEVYGFDGAEPSAVFRMFEGMASLGGDPA